MTVSFFAYPSNPRELTATVRHALQIIHEDFKKDGYVGWEQNDIAGRFLVDPILSKIQECSLLAADVTFINFNVVYEIGFAIGKQRRVILVRNSALSGDDAVIKEVGLFDTLGYREYEQAKGLASIITLVNDLRPLPAEHPINVSVRSRDVSPSWAGRELTEAVALYLRVAKVCHSTIVSPLRC
jgi:hypothetical protein